MSGNWKSVGRWNVWLFQSKNAGYVVRDIGGKMIGFRVTSSRILWEDLNKVPKYVKNAVRLMIISPSSAKYKRAKYKLGERVYSWQNPSTKRPITMIREAEAGNTSQNRYKVSLLDDDGYTYSSKWINENSISKRKLR